MEAARLTHVRTVSSILPKYLLYLNIRKCLKSFICNFFDHLIKNNTSISFNESVIFKQQIMLTDKHHTRHFIGIYLRETISFAYRFF